MQLTRPGVGECANALRMKTAARPELRMGNVYTFTCASQLVTD